ncbi:uncharacterized protein LACBIDRAFT_335918 [Laccaria bicolor S238N-H82]|uniref:Predicted protein n=1 Tax=Laccaria bicolor (strain S238N-H82 / ATCC MYA-4686) TaxID=486041 RepID=B0E3U2_LACBS|nr:uncharacterized protein LACBIDRAFT_335918 [Laccaria bicolor S238N-H82]EDQ98485.1 predicted protein [Laccaria bicolor S238N-H82]|eukprot:XP_001890858.1 predicted protein [Laccaria bicolor S238N-H82]
MAPMISDVDPAVVVMALTCKASNPLLQPIRITSPSSCPPSPPPPALLFFQAWTFISSDRTCAKGHHLHSECALFSSEFLALSPFWVAATQGPGLLARSLSLITDRSHFQTISFIGCSSTYDNLNTN